MFTLGKAVEAGGRKCKEAATFSLLSPALAAEITVGMVDGFWAHFYATGLSAGVDRVMDVAAGYWEFVEEFGNAPYLDYGEDLGSIIPPELADAPHVAARFNASRHALWSLLWHTQRHTAVGDIYAASLKSLNDRAVLSDLGGRGGAAEEAWEEGGIGITAFGKDRLSMMLHIKGTMEALASEAWEKGVGSGTWPETFHLLHKGLEERVSVSECGGLIMATPLNSLPTPLPAPISQLMAEDSLSLSQEAPGKHGSTLSHPVPLDSRDRRFSKLRKRPLA